MKSFPTMRKLILKDLYTKKNNFCRQVSKNIVQNNFSTVLYRCIKQHYTSYCIISVCCVLLCAYIIHYTFSIFKCKHAFWNWNNV